MTTLERDGIEMEAKRGGRSGNDKGPKGGKGKRGHKKGKLARVDTVDGSRIAREDDLYAIAAGKSRVGAPHWTVTISRRTILLKRTFPHGVWGGEAEALAIAKAWRDAVLDIIPPLTNRERARKPLATTTGDIGVYRHLRWGKDPVYVAKINHKGQTRSASFAIRDHGEDGARRLAIAPARGVGQRTAGRVRHRTGSSGRTCAEPFSRAA
nr:AP2 domain-containing protein [Marinicella sp. W31]MDC2877032.1 AP2 domain-containing protein [Marinicella sp. W31]